MKIKCVNYIHKTLFSRPLFCVTSLEIYGDPPLPGLENTAAQDS